MPKRSLASELAKEARPQPGTETAQQPAQEEKPKGKRRRPIGLYLRNDTLAAVQDIAAENNDIPIHALLVYAVSYFIREYRKGKVKIETQTKTTLKTDI